MHCSKHAVHDGLLSHLQRVRWDVSEHVHVSDVYLRATSAISAGTSTITHHEPRRKTVDALA